MGLLGKILGKENKPQIKFDAIDDESFRDKVLAADKPVMLFLWSNTCPYCRKMAPNVLNVLQRHGGEVIGFQANAGEVPRISATVQLRGVPATVFFHRGKMVDFVGGFRPEDYLDDLIVKHFGEQG